MSCDAPICPKTALSWDCCRLVLDVTVYSGAFNGCCAIQETGLLETMGQLAVLEDAPFDEDFDIVARAKEVALFWGQKFGV